MSTWWYLHNNERIGPIEDDELKRLLQHGAVSDATMVWKEGIGAWTQLDRVPELNGLRAAVPPPVPIVNAPQLVLECPVAGNWRRFFARIFDLWWESLLLGWCAAYLLGQYSPAFISWIGKPASSQIFGFFVLPFAFLFDALVYGVFGSTPGKALLRIAVADATGERLSLGRYIGRNAAVWSRGFGFGIPLVNLFAFYRQSGYVHTSGRTSYDENTGVHVRAGKAGWLRTGLFLLLTIALVVTIGVLKEQDREIVRAHQQVSEQKFFIWQNPVTGLNSSINAQWRYSQSKNDDGEQVYTFTELNGRAVVIIGVERNMDVSLGGYAAALQEAQKADIRYKDGGKFLELDAHSSWQSSGVMLEDKSNAVEMRVTQVNGEFWRIVSIQAPPYAYSNEMVANLKRELWKTVIQAKPKTTA